MILLSRTLPVAALIAFAGCSSRETLLAPGPDASSGTMVRGFVFDTTGTAVVGAVVSLEPAVGAVPRRALEMRSRPGGSLRNLRGPGDVPSPAAVAGGADAVPTGANGGFAFRDVPGGAYILTAVALHHLAGSKTITVPDAPPGSPAETLVVVISLSATGSFEGRATLDGATGHGGTVVFVAGTSAVALTDSHGDYHLADVPLGTWTVTASHAGYLDRTTQGTLSAAGQVVTLEDLVLSRDLNLPPTASILVDRSCIGYPTTLTAGADDPDGSVVRFEWDFEDDGGIDTSGTALESVAHTYAIGTHRAKLVVTDDHGARGVAVETFSIAPAETMFVSSSTGSPAGPGTRAEPFSTVSAALPSAGEPCPRVVLVALGDYAESPAIYSPTILRGGFDPAAWQQVPGARTEIRVGGSPATVTWTVDGIEVSDIQFTATSLANPSASAIALVVQRCPSTVRFDRCRFVAGVGRNASAGTAGNAGLDGQAGPNANGKFPGVWYTLPHGRPQGGNGGFAEVDIDPPQPGVTGRSGCVAGGPGGAGGANAPCDGVPVAGHDGQVGPNGLDGTNGTGQVESGHLGYLSWIPNQGSAGSQGCSGSGGGGGGAGGSRIGAACSVVGGGGGAGAAGGTAGERGTGGDGGGASIAVAIRDASPVFVDCEFVTASGGPGGAGGDGGRGGASRLGGSGGAGAANGGNGGASGRGGHAGGGQGGPGGPSWCILRLGTSNPTVSAPAFTPGTGGAGGPGGLLGGVGPPADPGPAGPSGIYGP